MAWTNYGQIIRRNIKPYLGAKRLSDLSPLDVKRWHGKLLAGGRADGGPLAVRSVQLSHRVLHRALADAVRWNLIALNPASGVRVPKGERKEMKVWTAEDAKRFLDALADDRLVALWTLALHTGLRRGELAGLRWSDVDLDEGTLTVAQQRTSANYVTVVTAPKAKSHRQLLLAPATVAGVEGAPQPPASGAPRARTRLDGQRLRVRRRARRRVPPATLHEDVRGRDPISRCRPQDPPPRHAPHDGDAGAGGGRPSEGRAGAARVTPRSPSRWTPTPTSPRP